MCSTENQVFFADCDQRKKKNLAIPFNFVAERISQSVIMLLRYIPTADLVRDVIFLLFFFFKYILYIFQTSQLEVECHELNPGRSSARTSHECLCLLHIFRLIFNCCVDSTVRRK